MAKVQKRRRRRAEEVLQEELEKRGGHCQECDWSATFNWHHRDPSTKLFPIAGAIGSRPIGQLKAELEKCDLLCPNHHSLRTLELREEVA